MHENKAYPSSAAQDYSPVDTNAPGTPRSKWNPLGWPKWAKITGVIVIVAIIVAIIVGAVEGSKKNAYPNYSKLNYSIEDRYEGEEFFDNFYYFDGYDPAEGFVQYVLTDMCRNR